jgi:hypothetical protein
MIHFNDTAPKVGIRVWYQTYLWVFVKTGVYEQWELCLDLGFWVEEPSCYR